MVKQADVGLPRVVDPDVTPIHTDGLTESITRALPRDPPGAVSSLRLGRQVMQHRLAVIVLPDLVSLPYRAELSASLRRCDAAGEMRHSAAAAGRAIADAVAGAFDLFAAVRGNNIPACKTGFRFWHGRRLDRAASASVSSLAPAAPRQGSKWSPARGATPSSSISDSSDTPLSGGGSDLCIEHQRTNNHALHRCAANAG